MLCRLQVARNPQEKSVCLLLKGWDVFARQQAVLDDEDMFRFVAGVSLWA